MDLGGEEIAGRGSNSSIHSLGSVVMEESCRVRSSFVSFCVINSVLFFLRAAAATAGGSVVVGTKASRSLVVASLPISCCCCCCSAAAFPRAAFICDKCWQTSKSLCSRRGNRRRRGGPDDNVRDTMRREKVCFMAASAGLRGSTIVWPLAIIAGGGRHALSFVS